MPDLIFEKFGKINEQKIDINGLISIIRDLRFEKLLRNAIQTAFLMRINNNQHVSISFKTADRLFKQSRRFSILVDDQEEVLDKQQYDEALTDMGKRHSFYFQWCEMTPFLDPNFDIRNFLERNCDSIRFKSECDEITDALNQINIKLQNKRKCLGNLKKLQRILNCEKENEKKREIAKLQMQVFKLYDGSKKADWVHERANALEMDLNNNQQQDLHLENYDEIELELSVEKNRCLKTCLSILDEVVELYDKECRILEAMNIEINNLNDLRTVNIDQSDQIEDFLTVIDPVKDNNILNSESNFGLNEIKKQEIQMMENEINAMDERDQKATNNIEFIEEQIKVGKERNVNLKKKCEHLDRMQCVLTSCRLYPPIVDERKIHRLNELFKPINKKHEKIFSSVFAADEISLFTCDVAAAEYYEKITAKNGKILLLSQSSIRQNLGRHNHRRLSDLIAALALKQPAVAMIRQTILKNCLKVTSVDDAKQVIVNGCDRATTDEAICFSPNGPMTISNENYFKRECDRTVYYCINSGASQMLSSYSSLDAEIQKMDLELRHEHNQQKRREAEKRRLENDLNLLIADFVPNEEAAGRSYTPLDIEVYKTLLSFVPDKDAFLKTLIDFKTLDRAQCVGRSNRFRNMKNKRDDILKMGEPLDNLHELKSDAQQMCYAAKMSLLQKTSDFIEKHCCNMIETMLRNEKAKRIADLRGQGFVFPEDEPTTELIGNKLPSTLRVQHLKDLVERHNLLEAELHRLLFTNTELIVNPATYLDETSRTIRALENRRKQLIRRQNSTLEQRETELRRLVHDLDPIAQDYYKKLTQNPKYRTQIICDDDILSQPITFQRDFLYNSNDNHLAVLALFLAANTVRKPTVLVLDGVLSEMDDRKHGVLIDLLKTRMLDQNTILLALSTEHRSLHKSDKIYVAYDDVKSKSVDLMATDNFRRNQN